MASKRKRPRRAIPTNIGILDDLHDYKQPSFRRAPRAKTHDEAVARHRINRGAGRIINIAFVRSELARPGIVPYTATKGAVKNLTRGMCADRAKYGLQINAIAPGYFTTPLNQALVDNAEFSAWLEKRTPAARWGNVDNLVEAAVFLSSKASSFVNGHTLYVDGGTATCL